MLEPFDDATNAIQGEEIVTSSKVIPCIVGLEHHLLQSEKETKYCAELIDGLKTSLEKRMKIYSENKPFILATVLDPRFKNSCLEISNEKISEMLQMEANNLPKKEVPVNLIPHHADLSMSSEPPKKKSKLFSFLNEKRFSKEDNENSIQSEFLEYTLEPLSNDDSDPLQYWKQRENKFPNLAKLARKYLTICASSAPVERLFSVAGKFYTNSRTQLKADNFENLILIKMNKHCE